MFGERTDPEADVLPKNIHVFTRRDKKETGNRSPPQTNGTPQSTLPGVLAFLPKHALHVGAVFALEGKRKQTQQAPV
jgi:hypothetical protein